MSKRVLDLDYVKEASSDNYDLKKPYSLISAKDTKIVPDPEMLKMGVDIGLMRLHIYQAPERRQWLGLREDRNYEIMVTFTPVHLHGTGQGEVMKVKYSKFFNIKKKTQQVDLPIRRCFRI